MRFYFYPRDDDNGEVESLLFYLVPDGAEYFLHMSLWPNVPFQFTMDDDTESMDIALRKTVTQIDEDVCNSEPDYDFIG